MEVNMQTNNEYLSNKISEYENKGVTLSRKFKNFITEV